MRPIRLIIDKGVVRLATLVVCAFVASLAGGCAKGFVHTVVTSPAEAGPGQIAFGKGVVISSGTKIGFSAADAIVVASMSDPAGPNERSEGDAVWRVRGGVLELCEWSADGRDDCRIATYEGFAAPPLLTFVPTIVEPGNLARGTQLLIIGDRTTAITGDVAKKKTESLAYSRDKGIWVTAGAAALLGAQPAFYCSASDDGPTCRALPFVVRGAVGMFALRNGKDRKSVLWVHAAENVGAVAFALPKDLGLYRCEANQGVPSCKKAEIGQ